MCSVYMILFNIIINTVVYIDIPAYCVSVFIILFFIFRCVGETQPRRTQGQGQAHQGEAPGEEDDAHGEGEASGEDQEGAPRQGAGG